MKKEKSGSQQGLSRREFIKTAAAGAAGIAAASAMAGCATTGSANVTGADRYLTPAGKAWRTPPAPIPAGQIKDGGTYDVVVCGGGQAGIWTARAASKNGAKVAVIEKQTEDKFMIAGCEVASINSEYTKSLGCPPVDEVEFLNEVFRRNAGRSNQVLLRRFARTSGKLLDQAIADITAYDPNWMKENAHMNGVNRDPAMIMNPSGWRYFVGTVNFRNNLATGGLETSWGPGIGPHIPEMGIMKLERQLAQKDGAEWKWGHEACYVEKDGSGRVVALIARNNADGAYYRFTGKKGIALCLGDFGANEDMIRDINDEYRHVAESFGDVTLAKPGMMNDGMGLKIGIWAGGHIEVGPHAGMNTNQSAPQGPWGPGFLLLNQAGKRFCDEIGGGAEGPGYMGPRQPRGYIAAFADADWYEVAKKMPPCHGALDFTEGLPYPITIGNVKKVMAAIKPSPTPTKYMAMGEMDVYCANTLSELIDIMKIYSPAQKETALAEIARYNQLAKAKKDEDFGADARIIKAIEKPPFYAVFTRSDAIGSGLCQTTGLDVSGEMEVLDSNLNPIPGLYAAGNNSGNRYIVNYATPIAGMSVGFCMTEGNYLGEKLAKL
jgi:succinate dehydrogenase/fumarate reductase flavoprotein subunit